MSTKFPNMAAAMKVYEEQEHELKRCWDCVVDNDSLKGAEEKERVMLQMLQDAAFADTKDFNGREHCALLSVRDIKALLVKA